MWDNKIRIATIGEKNKGRDYANLFMPKMQTLAKGFLNSYVEEKGGDLESASRDLSNLADEKTTPKLIDEYNYVIYTKGKSLSVIRSSSL
jgi:hypothetical protein